MARHRPRTTTTALLALPAFVLAACGADSDVGSAAPTASPSPASTSPSEAIPAPASPEPTPSPGRTEATAQDEPPAEAEVGAPIALDALPAMSPEGVAVELDEGLVFVDLDGTVHGHAPGAALETVRGLQHAPAGLVPAADGEYGSGWVEPASGAVWPGSWGTPLIDEATVHLDPHAGSPDAYVIHLPHESVAQWERDDRWWLGAGHRAVTWERCPEGAEDLAACPMRGHDRDTGGDVELDAGCWVADTRRSPEQLRVCTDLEAEPRSWLELGAPGEEPDRYELTPADGAPEDQPSNGRFLSAELGEGWILAQASTECEVPVAALIDVDSGAVKGVFGEDEPRTVSAQALGWVRDGRAAVLVHEPPCAAAVERPGVWLVHPIDGDHELVYPLPQGTAAEAHLWRPVPDLGLAERASAGVVDAG